MALRFTQSTPTPTRTTARPTRTHSIRVPVAVTQEISNELRAIGGGAAGEGTVGVGFLAAGREPFSAGTSAVSVWRAGSGELGTGP